MAGLHALEVGARFARLLGYGTKKNLQAAGMGSGSAQFSPAEPSLRLPPNGGIKGIAALISSAIGLVVRVLLEPFERRIRRERSLTRLMALNDHQLRDIGLARLDIQAAAMGIYGAPGYEMISPDPAFDDGADEGDSSPGAASRITPSSRLRTTSVPVTAKRRATYQAVHRRGGAKIAHLRPKTVNVVAAGRRG